MVYNFATIDVLQFACLSDNYGFLVRDRASGLVAAVDTPDGERIAAAADEQGWRVDMVLNTHWHPDHIGGNEALVRRYGAKVVAPAGEGDKIPHVDRHVADGDRVMLGGTEFEVLGVPGHTLGHIAYRTAGAVFVGDTLFSLGCGRMFEGTPDQFWRSLSRLKALPGDTTVFCAHEYTEANARFALSVDGSNESLSARADEVAARRRQDLPTVPIKLADELAQNPFLRADEAALATSVGLSGAPPEAVFAELRERKDRF